MPAVFYMVTKMLLKTGFAALSILLASCSGQDDSFGCESLPAGSSVRGTAAPTCIACVVLDPESAIDRNTDSYAWLSVGGSTPNQSAGVSGHLPSGLTLPAGAQVGALVMPEGTPAGAQFVVTTFLGGVQQETGTVASSAAVASNGSKASYFLATTKAFDEVQFTVERPGVPGGFGTRVYELCTGKKF